MTPQTPILDRILIILERSFIAASILTLAACGGVNGGSDSLPAPSEVPAVSWSGAARSELLTLKTTDQAVRAEFITLLQQGGPPDSMAWARITARQDSTDRSNTAHLKRMIKEHGWPTKAAAGEEGAEAAFLIVQHATHDPEFQKAFLAFLVLEFERGDAPGESVALLTDRTRQANGLNQLYGTQMSIQDGQIRVDPIEDPDRVSQRRESLGLVPLQEYIEQVKKAYGLSG